MHQVLGVADAGMTGGVYFEWFKPRTYRNTCNCIVIYTILNIVFNNEGKSVAHD